MPDILISENVRGAAVDELSRKFSVEYAPDLWKSPEMLRNKIADFRALIVRNQTKVTAPLLTAARNLKVVGRAGIGLDNIDLVAARQHGIAVAYTPDQNAISVAEIALGMMLCLARMIPAADADTKAGHWNRHAYTGTELYGKTLGIIAAGKIGFLTGRRAQAFGMHILAHDPFLSRDNVFLSELQARLTNLDDLLANSDFVSCHLPSTPQTTGMLNASCFRKMKPSAFFINTARGEVVNETDLVDALRNRTIAGAALDVRAKEPPVAGELEQMPNVLLTPHIAAFTHEAQDRVTYAVCEDVTRALTDRPLVHPAW
jgi:D-3-phosphoglycerate dehydrogenase